MSNYMTKAAAHARLLKLASAARLIRRQRELQKYAQAVQMQKQALSTGATAGIGAGLGGLIGGGIGYGLGKKDKKLLSTLIGAGAGAGIGGLGGWGLGAWNNRAPSPVGPKGPIDITPREAPKTLFGKPAPPYVQTPSPVYNGEEAYFDEYGNLVDPVLALPDSIDISEPEDISWQLMQDTAPAAASTPAPVPQPTPVPTQLNEAQQRAYANWKLNAGNRKFGK